MTKALYKVPISEIEHQINQRLQLPYRWGQRQNNSTDKITNFIYDILEFNDLLKMIQKKKLSENERNYTLNRWYNYWSARGVEEIFTQLKTVQSHPNPKSRWVDFYIQGINFDHKTSVFPSAYSRNLYEAMKDKEHLIQWLYQHQSRGRRFHLRNRLFLVLYSNTGEHWKLKAELNWLKSKITTYVESFDPKKLMQLKTGNSRISSDVIWAIR